MNLFSPVISQLEHGLQASALKQKTYAANIANVDTPNFKAQRVSFQSVLENQLSSGSLATHRTDPRHISFSKSSVSGIKLETLHTTQRQPNGNNVDIDLEMAELAKNQLWYNAMTERISGKFSTLRSVINEGK